MHGVAIEAKFPGRAEIVTAIWRMKQLEYSWLRTMMGRWQDFRSVTCDSLRYTIDAVGMTADAPTLERLVAAQDHRSPYPDAEQALAGLSGGLRPLHDDLQPLQPLEPSGHLV